MFGCTYFVHRVSQGLDKLFTKAIKNAFWDILTFKKGINVTLPQPKDITCLLLLPSLRTHFFFVLHAFLIILTRSFL